MQQSLLLLSRQRLHASEHRIIMNVKTDWLLHLECQCQQVNVNGLHGAEGDDEVGREHGWEEVDDEEADEVYHGCDAVVYEEIFVVLAGIP